MTRNVATVLAGSLAVVVLAAAALAGNRGKTVKPDDLKKIAAAVPAKAPAKPLKPRRVLVYSKCTGFWHRSIPYCNKAIELMGEKTGAFEAVVSDDLSNFTPAKLKTFDCVIFNNSTGDLLKDKQHPARTEEIRNNFLQWLRNGGAVVGIHAATDIRGWDEYSKMIGGKFSGHPWHMAVPIKNDDPTNPINAAFGGKGFVDKNEIYQFNKGFYSRHKQRVLLSIDMEKLAKITKRKGARQDNDYAISWVKTYGKGRIFYCSLGHEESTFFRPLVMKHILAGIQWALGDLKGVDTTPNPLPDQK
ncbi:MAG: ThuA domain-containing protein [Planctomycetes bacterium]|nr:ThuA domain-containing protein [Planctomycetota bacterium]